MCILEARRLKLSFHILSLLLDFTRLKLVQGKKQVEAKREAAAKEAEIKEGKVPAPQKFNETDITAEFDAADDEDVVF